MTETERIIVHIPEKNLVVPGANVPAAASVPAEEETFAPAPVFSPVEEAPVAPVVAAPVEAAPVAPVVEAPVTTVAPAAKEKGKTSPIVVPKHLYVPVELPTPTLAKAPVSDTKPVTASSYKVIDVTDNYRNDVFKSVPISYGIAVTEGGWESEIEDEDDVVVYAAEESVAEEVLAEEPAVEAADESVEETEAEGTALAAVAVIDSEAENTDEEEKETVMADNVQNFEQAPVGYAPAYEQAPVGYAPVYEGYPQAVAVAAVNTDNAYQYAYAPKNYDITEEYPMVEPVREEKPAPVAEKTERIAPLVAPIPFTVGEGEFENESKPEKKKKKSKRKAKNEFIFDPDAKKAPRDDAESAREYNGEEYGQHYDKYQIESEHLRFLTETKKLDKKKSIAENAKKVDAKAAKSSVTKGDISRISEKSAAVVAARMDYDSKFGSSDIAIELLKFTENVYAAEKENKRRQRLITKIKKSANKAKNLEKKATKRYYGVLASETVNPTTVKNPKKQERINSLITKLEALLKEREAIDDRLILLYRGAESKAGGRIRAKAEVKRRKAAKKVQRKLKGLNKRIEKINAPDSLIRKIRYLFNTKIVSQSTLVYSKYILKKLKPKGEARRELKRDIDRAKKSLYNIDDNIRRLMKKAYKYDGSARKESGRFGRILAFVVVIAAVAAVWFLFGNTIMSMLGMA